MRRPCRLSIGFTLLVAVVSWATLRADEAPEVAKFEPPNGATNVDPNLGELVVEFDQKMLAMDYSLCGSGPSFPTLLGKGTWRDPFTFVVPVRLEPDHIYDLSINCVNQYEFRNRTFQPVSPVKWHFISDTTVSRDAQKAINETCTDEVRKALKDYYVHLDRKGVDWDKRFGELHQWMIDARGTSEWTERMATLLGDAEDPFMSFSVHGVYVPSCKRTPPTNYRFSAIKKMLGSLKRDSDSVFSTRTDDGIGYMQVYEWRGDPQQQIAVCEKVLGELKDTKALIVDVRSNQGGDAAPPMAVAGWFVEGEHVYGKYVIRDPRKSSGLTKVYNRKIKGHGEPRQYKQRVALLIGPGTMGSAEWFVLAMKQGRHVRTFGESTAGHSGGGSPKVLSNGVQFSIPLWRDMLPDGTPTEGRGIHPDFHVKTTPADFETGDPVLEAALKALRKRLH